LKSRAKKKAVRREKRGEDETRRKQER